MRRRLGRHWLGRHWRSLTTVGAVGVLAVAFGLFWFQPWKLFTDQTVDDALPAAAVVALTTPALTTSATPSATPTVAASVEVSATPSSPSSVAAPADRLLSSGAFISHEHSTSGVASIVVHPDGSRVLAIADLNTSNGPELRVWLSNATAVTGESNWYIFDDAQYQHVSLGALKGNLGNQVYDIPASADLGTLTTVTIWCDRFNVSFGAANLKPS